MRAVEEVTHMIEVGKKAPAFTLANQDDEKVRLSSFLGKWVVLYFYPRDNTPGCTTQACEFTEKMDDFSKLDAVILGVSPDSPTSHQKFIAKQSLKITLLSDPEKTVLEKYGAWGEKKLYGKTSLGVIRSTVLIDPKGKVAAHWPKVRAKGHAEAVQVRLEELRADEA